MILLPWSISHLQAYKSNLSDIHGSLDLLTGKRGSAESDITASSNFSPRGSFAVAASEGSPPAAKAGTVVTSSRASKRR